MSARLGSGGGATTGKPRFRRISSHFCLAKAGCRRLNHTFFEAFHTKRLCGGCLDETNFVTAVTPRGGRAFDAQPRSTCGVRLAKSYSKISWNSRTQRRCGCRLARWAIGNDDSRKEVCIRSALQGILVRPISDQSWSRCLFYGASYTRRLMPRTITILPPGIRVVQQS